MCADYTPSRKEQIRQHFEVEPDWYFEPAEDFPAEAFPGYQAPILRRAPGYDKQIECLPACFGLLPHWADPKLVRSTYNARSETVDSKASFRHAWRRRQFCIIPASALFEPSYGSGKPVRWRIEQSSGDPFGIAGIWESRPGPEGRPLLSFSMLTINADQHSLMNQFHKPDEEKRMVAILRPAQYQGWLRGEIKPEAVLAMYPAELLSACADPLPPRGKPVATDWDKERAGKRPKQTAQLESGPAPDQGELF